MEVGRTATHTTADDADRLDSADAHVGRGGVEVRDRRRGAVLRLIGVDTQFGTAP